MELADEIHSALVSPLAQGTPYQMVKLLEKAEQCLRGFGTSEIVLDKEQAPERKRVANWSMGLCKRCMQNGVRDGDIIVKIYGKGWWHDECFRIVRPQFYAGL